MYVSSLNYTSNSVLQLAAPLFALLLSVLLLKEQAKLTSIDWFCLRVNDRPDSFTLQR